MPYHVSWASRRVTRQLNALPVDIRSRVSEAILQLEQEPRSFGVEKLKSGQYRIRVGRYRVIYDIDDKGREVVINEVVIRNERSYD